MRPNLVWFRDDLRLTDNPALHAACAGGAQVICLYIFDATPSLRQLGGAARWWLQDSVAKLAGALEKKGGKLIICRGDAPMIIEKMAAAGAVGEVFWNERHVPAAATLDESIARLLALRDIPLHRFNGSYLNPPSAITNSTGGPFKVFTPYWRAVLRHGVSATPLPAPEKIHKADWHADPQSMPVFPASPVPVSMPWMDRLSQSWQPGEKAAHQTLETFLENALHGYASRRDFPAGGTTSRLSPYLRHGEISPLQVWHALEIARHTGGAPQHDADKFINELIWREYACHVLHHFPSLSLESRDRSFDLIPWRNEPEQIQAWQQGRTGFPLIDAGMRQLWQTGWMHNRMRMIVGSFLVKHLLCDWRIGESWFWDTLVDADQASNVFGWQWVAGCGFDASPFHRIFNPVLQSERFDPKGHYIRTFVPELAHLPDQLIHTPWKAPPDLFEDNGRICYPRPIVDLAAGRERALNALKIAKSQTTY